MVNFGLEDYEVFFELLREDVQDQIRWLKSRKDPKYRLYNAGQIRALEYVLDIISFDSRRIG
ncbi:hypothetical protein [Geobacillus sp. E263]|uniref:hypothetical protein n=1 Tax=Geobacillus sp. E263 TaxID=391290 RepID=UPI00117AAD4F|nr:hypothetical protein [Geobacillus sp. E263]